MHGNCTGHSCCAQRSLANMALPTCTVERHFQTASKQVTRAAELIKACESVAPPMQYRKVWVTALESLDRCAVLRRSFQKVLGLETRIPLCLVSLPFRALSHTERSRCVLSLQIPWHARRCRFAAVPEQCSWRLHQRPMRVAKDRSAAVSLTFTMQRHICP
jgi:hypothetical protein